MADERAPVIVLAGGRSTRLGRDKASEVLAGRTLLQRAIDACAAVASSFVIVRAVGQALPAVSTAVPLRSVEDVFPETGPLGGIYTGLAALSTAAGPATALVVGCDMPLLEPGLLREILRLSDGYDAAAPVRDGLPEPLCAAYSAACTDPARRLLERGNNKVAGLLDVVNALLIPEEQWREFDAEGRSFLNVNREVDLDTARALLGKQ